MRLAIARPNPRAGFFGKRTRRARLLKRREQGFEILRAYSRTLSDTENHDLVVAAPDLSLDFGARLTVLDCVIETSC
jgi:hypothetical protein